MEALAQTDNVRDDATVSQFIPLLVRCGNLFGFVGKGHRWFAIFENDVNSCGTRPWKVSGVRAVGVVWGAMSTTTSPSMELALSAARCRATLPAMEWPHRWS